MATINGITIKSFKTFSGIEYPSIREANVWKDGKKIGTYREDEWGGPSHMTSGLSDIIRPSAIQYQSGCPDGRYKELQSDPDIFIGHLLTLAEYEKEYKRNCKNGRNYTLFIGNDWKWLCYGCSRPIPHNTTEELPDIIKKAIKKEFPNNDYVIWEGSNESDFILTVDETHPVPKFLERK